MVVSDAIIGRSRCDKNLVADLAEVHNGGHFRALAPEDTSKSSQVAPHSIKRRPPKTEAYVMIGAFENFMAAMSDSFLQ